MKLSLLDQLHISPGQSSQQALADTITLSRHLETLGFARHWIVEHHGVPYEICADPMLMALALAQSTQTIRIGVGGILLNNYSPYKVAETAKTLALLAPGRIDIGIGQSNSGELQDLALQTDRLHKPQHDQADKTDELLGHLFADLPADHRFHQLKIIPDAAPPMPWVMAVSAASAARAGAAGLPLALSAFHRPQEAIASAQAYRRAFRPSMRPGLPQSPKLFLAIRLCCAATHAEAEARAMPFRWAFDQRRRLGKMPMALPSIAQSIKLAGGVWPAETDPWPMYVIAAFRDIRGLLLRMAEAVGTDEIMVQDALPDPQMRRDHYAELADEISKG